MDKSNQYGSPPPAGFSQPQPPAYSSSNAYPPNSYPPNSYPPTNYPPANYPPTNYPPTNYPPTNYPPTNYPQQPQPTTNTVVITGGPTVITSFGPTSQPLVCPHCHHSISTKVENSATTKTHLCALFLCLFLCWPCCCCPYCTNSCQAQNHYCPHCNAFLGTYDS